MALTSWRRRATAGNAVAVTVLCTAILAVAVDAVDRHGPSWDLTSDGDGTLSVDLMAAVEAVDARGVQVRVTAFGAQKRSAGSYEEDRLLEDVLVAIEARTPWVVVDRRDLDADRAEAEALGVTRYGTVVVRGLGDRVDVARRDLFRFARATDAAGPDVRWVGDGALAAALRQVLAERHRVVYALRGHGERTVFDRGVGDLRVVASHVAAQGWTVRPLELLADGSEPTVPDDAAAVVVLGPSAPFSPVESRALRRYLRRGGRLFLTRDPGGSSPGGLEELGLQWPSGVVQADTVYYPHDDRPRLLAAEHETTRAVRADGLLPVLAHVAPVAAEPRDGVVAHPLLSTGAGGWVDRGGAQDDAFRSDVRAAWAFDMGPPATDESARLVAVGDTDWLDDALMTEAAGNATLLVNVLRWLMEVDEPLGSAGRGRSIRKVAMGRDDVSRVRWGLAVIWPGLVGLFGVAVVRWRRR